MAKGLFTNSELVDSIIVDLNNLVKEIVAGQYIQGCRIVTSMSQKLVNLRTTIDNDLKCKDEKIESLKQAIRDIGGECEDHPIEEYIDGGKCDGGTATNV